MRALIVEQGWSRGALAAARALAAGGWTVGVASPERSGLAVRSRACRQRHRIDPLRGSVPAFVDEVAAVVRAGGYDVVFGAGEAELLALSAGRDALPAAFPHAAHDDVVRAVDKVALSEAAAEVGIAVPQVLDLRDVPDDGTPVVVKARLHARPDDAAAPPRIDTTVVTGRHRIAARLAEIRAQGGEPQIQRFHTGTLIAYSAVHAGTGGVVAECAQRAERIWPPDAGASCRARTVEPDPVLVGRCTALLDRLRWFGLAELQFLVGPDDVPRLIDLNGRFYGSLSLAVAAGANLPAVWADLAVGRTPARAVQARPGVRYQWGTGDLRRAVRERQGGVLRDLVGTAAYAVDARQSVWHPADPGPALARAAQACRLEDRWPGRRIGVSQPGGPRCS